MLKTSCYGYFNERVDCCKLCVLNKDCHSEFLKNTIYQLVEVLKIDLEIQKIQNTAHLK